MCIKRTIVAVPARLESSRLPNKVLSDIGGQPNIQRVLQRCCLASLPASVVLCADCLQFQELATSLGFPVIHLSRVQLDVADHLNKEGIV